METEDIYIVIRRNKRSRDKKLQLNNRSLSSLPQVLFSLKHLEKLDLSNNKLQLLGNGITKLVNLKQIDLSNNKLSSIPQNIKNLSRLQKLFLMGNPLMGKFKQLKKQENCSQPKLGSILSECFQEDDDFQLNDDDFNFGDTPIVTRKTSKNHTIVKKLEKYTLNIQDIQDQENKDDPGDWLQGFDEDTEEQQKDNILHYNDDTHSIQQTVKRQKQTIAELENRLMQLQKQPERINTARQLHNNYNSHEILEVDYNELVFGKKISQGGFSIVYKGKFRGTTVAIKKIFNPVITKELMQEFNNEIRILNQHRHPNFIMLMAIVTKPPNLCIVTDFAHNGVKFKREELLKFSIETSRAILYLHYANIVHRDIKTLNVLLDNKNTVKLCDFGLARHINDLNKGAGTYVGTPNYMAPEIYNQRQLTNKIDVFAYGTMLWEIFSRNVPYDGLDPQDIMKKLKNGDQLSSADVPSKLMNLIKKCREYKPEKRPSFSQIYNYLNKITVKDLY